MTIAFWIAIGIDAVLLLILLGLSLAGGGGNDGGREMAIVFSIIFPLIVVAAGALLFLKSTSTAARAFALLLVAAPGLFVGGARLRSAYIDYQVRQNSKGSGYFSNRDVKRAAEAIVKRDLDALKAIDKSLDVNAKGSHDMTLMELAITQAYDTAGAGGPERAFDLVRELLSRGADPNSGLILATKLPEPAMLTLLLDKGASAGFAPDQQPIVFSWLNVMPLENFTLLLDRKLDPNIVDSIGTPLVMAAGQNDRWNFVLLLLDRGADPKKPDAHGYHLSDVVQSRLEPTSNRPADMMADIKRVQARIAQ